MLLDNRNLIFFRHLSILEQTLAIFDIFEHMRTVSNFLLKRRVPLKAGLLNLLSLLLVQRTTKVKEFALSWCLLFVSYLLDYEFLDILEDRRHNGRIL